MLKLLLYLFSQRANCHFKPSNDGQPSPPAGDALPLQLISNFVFLYFSLQMEYLGYNLYNLKINKSTQMKWWVNHHHAVLECLWFFPLLTVSKQSEVRAGNKLLSCVQKRSHVATQGGYRPTVKQVWSKENKVIHFIRLYYYYYCNERDEIVLPSENKLEVVRQLFHLKLLCSSAGGQKLRRRRGNVTVSSQR